MYFIQLVKLRETSGQQEPIVSFKLMVLNLTYVHVLLLRFFVSFSFFVVSIFYNKKNSNCICGKCVIC